MSRPVYHNLTPVGPHTNPADMAAMIEANTTAVQLNNEGNAARKRGDLDAALSKHLRALELKIRGFGEASVQAANSFGTLGETYLAMGRLDAAEANMRKALRVRDDKATGGLEMGPRCDAAVTRDNIGRVLEARGDMDGARAARLRISGAGEVMCGSDNCVTPGGAMLSEKQRKACGACRAVFYCSAACQKKDWAARHKPFCKTYAAAKKADATSTATSGS